MITSLFCLFCLSSLPRLQNLSTNPSIIVTITSAMAIRNIMGIIIKMGMITQLNLRVILVILMCKLDIQELHMVVLRHIPNLFMVLDTVLVTLHHRMVKCLHLINLTMVTVHLPVMQRIVKRQIQLMDLLMMLKVAKPPGLGTVRLVDPRHTLAIKI